MAHKGLLVKLRKERANLGLYTILILRNTTDSWVFMRLDSHNPDTIYTRPDFGSCYPDAGSIFYTRVLLCRRIPVATVTPIEAGGWRTSSPELTRSARLANIGEFHTFCGLFEGFRVSFLRGVGVSGWFSAVGSLVPCAAESFWIFKVLGSLYS